MSGEEKAKCCGKRAHAGAQAGECTAEQIEECHGESSDHECCRSERCRHKETQGGARAPLA